MSEWFETLDGLREQAWQRLSRGVADKRAPSRRPILATRGTDGGAEARMVVLRGADRETGTLEIHTDIASPKIAELRAEPRASLVIWEAKADLQIRLRTVVDIVAGPEADRAWDRVPEPARDAYGGTPEPGRPLPAPERYEAGARRDRFAILRARITRMDLLHLGRDMQRRAVLGPGPDYAGTWVAP